MTEGNTAIQVSPFNPEDREMTRGFFEKIADTVVEASELTKVVAQLRGDLDRLRIDVESYRAENFRLDSEVQELRGQRDEARSEAHGLREVCHKQEVEVTNLNMRNDNLARLLQEAEASNAELIDSRRAMTMERDDAQIKVMELEDSFRQMEQANCVLLERANRAEGKLETLRSIFTS